MLIPNIRNKIKRNEVFMKEKQKQLKEKLVMKKKRKVLEQNDPKLLKKRLAQNVQKTLDNKRTKNDTIPQTNEDLEELNQELQHDEFSSVLNNLENSKILLTTAKRAPKNIYKFIKEFQTIVNCQFVKRSSQFNLGHIKDICLEREFTDLIIVNHDKKVVNGLTIMHLPDGPTAYFKLSSFVDSKSIRGHATLGATNPELILNGFSTRLGTTVGRMFSCLFPKRPEFEGRQVVTLHNQRDFIFFRRHRYIFKADAIEYDENEDENQENEKQDDGDTPKMDEGPTSEFETRGTGVDIQEIGPRFCLKLQWLLNGTDIKNGEYEWMHKPELDLTRTTFHL